MMRTEHFYSNYDSSFPDKPGKRRPSVRKRKKRRFTRLRFVLSMLFLILLLSAFSSMILSRTTKVGTHLLSLFSVSATDQVRHYADTHGLTLNDYPQNLIDLYARNSETKDFVLEYPLQKDRTPTVNLGNLNTSSVPLLMQWDQQWGYKQYAGDLFGLTGCGPTCLSMVSIYLTENTSMNPSWMADFATSHGYASDGNGSSWTLFSEGAEELGFDVTEIPLDKQRILNNLDVRNPIVAVVGKGDFTSTGHFIVLTGCQSGKIKVNDPNSKANSEKLWDFDRLKGQIRNLWVIRN